MGLNINHLSQIFRNNEVYDFPVNEEEERSGENDDNETTDAPTEITTQPPTTGREND